MKAKFIVILSSFLLFAGIAYFDVTGRTKAGSPKESSKLEFKGEPAPDFTFTAGGREMNLSDFRGKVVLLHFWASWCAPCLKELPALSGMLKKTGSDIIVIAVSSDQTDDAMNKFIRAYTAKGDTLFKMNEVKVFWDGGGKITADIFNTYKLPETIVISPDGRMVRKIAGDYQWDSQETIDYLKSLAK